MNTVKNFEFTNFTSDNHKLSGYRKRQGEENVREDRLGCIVDVQTKFLGQQRRRYVRISQSDIFWVRFRMQFVHAEETQ